MNFIYSILMFLTFSLSAFGISTQIEQVGPWHDFYIGCSTVSGLVTVVFTFCMMFRQMEFSKDFRERVNYLRFLKDEIESKTKDLARYKTELQDALTKLYPEYEKELFKGMSPIDSENLSVIMIKYPELKFNGILTEYTNGIQTKLNSIQESEKNIIYQKRLLEDINSNGWKFGTFTMPTI